MSDEWPKIYDIDTDTLVPVTQERLHKLMLALRDSGLEIDRLRKACAELECALRASSTPPERE